jgi:hypothetical protein
MISIDSVGGYISIGDFSISWGNSEDPFFEGERLEGYFSINAGKTSLEFGAIDQERPGVYITKYRDGEVEVTTPLLQF